MNPESQFSLHCNTDNNLIYAHCLQSIIKFQFSFEIWTIQWLCLFHEIFQCCRSCGFSCNSSKLSWLWSRCRDKCKHIFSSYYHHQSCHCQQYSLKYLLHLTSLFIAQLISNYQRLENVKDSPKCSLKMHRSDSQRFSWFSIFSNLFISNILLTVSCLCWLFSWDLFLLHDQQHN